jgi:Lrp/AsnC family transcriptional regulator for asnA, asnC and gidA
MRKMKREMINSAGLDDFDEAESAVLDALKLDGRVSSVDLAKRTGLAEATVRRKIQRILDDPGIAVQAVVRPLRNGYGISAIIGFDVERGSIEQVADKLCKFSFVESVYSMTGPFDIIIQMSVNSITELFYFLNEELRSMKGIKDSESYLIGKVYKHNGRRYA